MAYVDLSLPKFQEKFADEESCLQAILQARWPRGFICPHCHHNDGIRLHCRPRVIECRMCKRQTSITSGTLFHKSHVALQIWFLCIYLFAQDKGGGSAVRLSKQLGVSQPTAWFMLQRLRIAMSTRDENLTLAGYIELDEAFFGGRSKSKRNRKPPSDNKKQVLILVESGFMEAGNLVMKVIDGPDYDVLKPIIADKVESDPPGQFFRSDAWGSHHVVTALGHHINMAPVPIALQDKALRCVNLAVSNAKSFFKGTYHHFCKVHIQRYLDEFCYRWNRRHVFGELALHLLTASVLHAPVPYKSVVASRLTA